MRRGWKKAHGSDRVTMINGDISDWSASLCDILLKLVTNGWQFPWRQARRHDEKTKSHQKLQFSSRWLINDKSEHLGFQKGCSTTTTPNPPCQSIWQKAEFWERTKTAGSCRLLMQLGQSENLCWSTEPWTWHNNKGWWPKNVCSSFSSADFQLSRTNTGSISKGNNSYLSLRQEKKLQKTKRKNWQRRTQYITDKKFN